MATTCRRILLNLPQKQHQQQFSKFGTATVSTSTTITTRATATTPTRPTTATTTTKKTTVDQAEIAQFEQFGAEWWDVSGPMKPLHSLNQIRVPFIRDGLINIGVVPTSKVNTPEPLSKLNVLDVGCGAGILCEPLSRLGSSVVGLDANETIINQARNHADQEKLKNTSYVFSSIEDHAPQNKEKYDVVVASEILEHVLNKEEFLAACLDCLKPKGSIFITTINKTNVSNFSAIFLAESLFGFLPKGTHQYDKFIEPHRLQRLLEEHGCKTELVHGMFYNPFTNSWSWCSDCSVNYALHAFKLPK